MIASEFGRDRAHLFIACEHQESRRATVRFHASEIEAWLILHEFARAVRPHRAAAMLVRIDQRRERGRGFDRGIEADAQLADEGQCQTGTPSQR